jgi:hypothetical protein
MSRRHGHSLRPRCTQQDRICQAGEAAGCRCRCHGASWRLMVKRFAGSAPRVIAVRDCPRQRLGADIAARPHAVLHHDRSPEPGLKSFSEYARYEVDAAASREGDDQPHRPGGGLRVAVSWTAVGEADVRTRATTGAMRFRKAVPPSAPVLAVWREMCGACSVNLRPPLEGWHQRSANASEHSAAGGNLCCPFMRRATMALMAEICGANRQSGWLPSPAASAGLSRATRAAA